MNEQMEQARLTISKHAMAIHLFHFHFKMEI